MQKYANTVTDTLGNVVSLASVSVYTDAAHTALATVYSDNGITPTTNPRTTDSLGNFSFYAADGRYYIKVTKTGVTTQFLDDVILFDSTASNSAASINTVQSGTGASTRTVQAKLRDVVSVLDFGADNTGVSDSTTAFNNAITYCLSTGAALYVPTGTYKITSTLTTITGQFTLFGDGPFKSLIQFAPTAADTLFYLDNGASKTTHIVMRDLGLYSTDTTYAKVGIDGRDLSVCFFERIYIRGTGMASGPGAGAGWSDTATSGSIGIRFNGREAVTVRGVEIIADKPIYFAANPNTAATDCEDCDHFHFQDCYFIGNGNYLVEFAAGIGASELLFDGFQAWVGGTGGLKINDTRVGPNIVSRGIKFKHVRAEQIADSAGYVFNMVFTAPAQSVKIENCLMASTSNGITINGCLRTVLDEVIAAQTSGTSLVTSGMTSSSVLTMRGCIWTTGGAVTLTGLSQITAEAYRSASFAAPSDAVYAGQIVDTRVTVEKLRATAGNGAIAIVATGTTGDGIQIIGQTAGSGGSIRAVNNSESDFTQLALTGAGLVYNNRTGVGTSAQAFGVDTLNNTAIGPLSALATNATDGFAYLPSCAGTPTGVPTAKTGKVAWVYDTTNNIIYIYNGAWKKTVALT